jgi:hypothetical protein
MMVAWQLFTKEGNSLHQGLCNLDFFSYKEETTHLICKNTSIYKQSVNFFVSIYGNVI